MLNLQTAVRRAAVFLDRWHWALLALAAPFLLFPSPGRSLALLVVPGLWMVAWLAGREPLPRTPFNGALLLLSLAVLVSLYATYDIAVSLPKVAGMVLGLGVFYAVVRVGQRPRPSPARGEGKGGGDVILFNAFVLVPSDINRSLRSLTCLTTFFPVYTLYRLPIRNNRCHAHWIEEYETRRHNTKE